MSDAASPDILVEIHDMVARPDAFTKEQLLERLSDAAATIERLRMLVDLSDLDVPAPPEISL